MFGLRLVNDMDALQNQMNRFFYGMDPSGSYAEVPFRVQERERDYLVRAELPGLDVEKLDISVLGRQLKISGEFISAGLPEDVRRLRRERRQGGFEKILHLGAGLNAEQIEAEYLNGILEIKLPKVEAAVPKKIAVNIG